MNSRANVLMSREHYPILISREQTVIYSMPSSPYDNHGNVLSLHSLSDAPWEE